MVRVAVSVGAAALAGAAIAVAALTGPGRLQREIEAALRNIQAGIAQRAGQGRRVLLQQIERLGLIGGHMRLRLAAGIDRQPDIDAAQFRRIEADFELLGAAQRARGDADRKRA